MAKVAMGAQLIPEFLSCALDIGLHTNFKK